MVMEIKEEANGFIFQKYIIKCDIKGYELVHIN